MEFEQAGVPSNVTDAEAVAFVKTWLEKVANATGKLPIIYSNPTFLKNHLSSDASLANYPLWAANYFDVTTEFPLDSIRIIVPLPIVATAFPSIDISN